MHHVSVEIVPVCAAVFFSHIRASVGVFGVIPRIPPCLRHLFVYPRVCGCVRVIPRYNYNTWCFVDYIVKLVLKKCPLYRTYTAKVALTKGSWKVRLRTLDKGLRFHCVFGHKQGGLSGCWTAAFDFFCIWSDPGILVYGKEFPCSKFFSATRRQCGN